MRKRLALALRLMAGRLDPVPAPPRFVAWSGAFLPLAVYEQAERHMASRGIAFNFTAASNGGPLPA
jgi:hypothetical protein